MAFALPMDHAHPDRRADGRTHVMFSTALATGERTVSVRVLDLSQGGALLGGEALPALGQCVSFERHGTTLRGTIAWASRDRVGVCLDAPCEVRSLMRHVPAPRPSVAASCRRPGFGESRLTSAERDSVRRCAETLGVSFSG